MKISPVPFDWRTTTMLCQLPSSTDALETQSEVVLIVPVDVEAHLAAGHREDLVLAVEVVGVPLLDDDAVGAGGLDPDGDAERAGADDIGRGRDGHVGGGPVELERLAGEAGAVGRAVIEGRIRGADRVLTAAVALPPGDQAGGSRTGRPAGR